MLRTVILALAAMFLFGCSGGDDAATVTGSGTSGCVFTAVPAPTATFTRTLTGNVLELGVDTPTAGAPTAYSIDFCLPRPHAAGIRGISALANMVATDADNSSDANLVLVLYETTGGNLMFTEVLITNTGSAVYNLESCDADDNCTQLEAQTALGNTVTQGTTLVTMSILWDGVNTINYTVEGTTVPRVINTTTYPVVDAQLDDTEVGFGLYVRSQAASTSTARFDNVQYSTDGSTWVTYDTFTGANGTYDGGGKWAIEEGTE